MRRFSRKSRRRLLIGTAALAVWLIAATTTAGGGSVAAVQVNWPAYQFSPAHGSYSATATTVTRTNAASLRTAWTWHPPAGLMAGQPAQQLNASPAVVGGNIYVGGNSGDFFKVSMATGALLNRRFLAYRPKLTCPSANGFSSSPTVATDPVSGQLAVYVGAADGYVYALRASDLTTLWRTQVAVMSPTQSDYFVWSSPTVANGRIYIGISSQCDKPLVSGAGVVALAQAGGAIIGRYSSNVRGASVWSSVAVDPGDGSVFVTSGNPLRVDQPGDAYSIVRLQGAPSNGQLVKLDKWTIPTADQTFDADFGASPTLFTASIGGTVTNMVAACDKNGYLYALRRAQLSAGPVWRQRIGNAGSDPNSCIGGLTWDGQRLYQGSNNTTIGGTSVPGSVRALNPATGAFIWQRALSNIVINTPTVDGSGVLATGTTAYGTGNNRVYLLNSSTGAILRSTAVSGNGMFAQAVFADDTVLFPTINAGVMALRP